ncbi:MAG: 3'-5' exonuclease [Muribaculaceae bacterium]
MKISIPKEKINELPVMEFTGNIYIIDSLSKMNMAIAALRKESIVGFDSETRPSFARGKINKVALLQISSFTDCFLFRINKIGLPDKLKKFIEDESIQKVGLSLNNDVMALRRIADVTPQGFIDLQQLVSKYCITDMSLQRIYAILFDKKISKSQRLTNWEATSLTSAQLRYAALDAYACLQIYDYLNNGNFCPEESHYILNEDLSEHNETEEI